MAIAGSLVRFLFHVLSVEFVDVNDFVDVKDLVDTNEERASSCGMSGDDWLVINLDNSILESFGCFSCFFSFFLFSSEFLLQADSQPWQYCRGGAHCFASVQLQ